MAEAAVMEILKIKFIRIQWKFERKYRNESAHDASGWVERKSLEIIGYWW